MYNYNFKVTYKDDKNEKESNILYQQEILKAFNMEEFDTNILVKKITILFNKFNKDFNEIFEMIKKRYKIPFILDDFACFQILFSWENFFKIHQFLKIYFNENKMEKNIILKHLLNI